MADIAIIGAGVVGVSTAYMMARRGYRVTLIDAAGAPGSGASAGNAAQLSWAYGDAMASPALIRHLPGIMLGRDPAFRIGWQADPDFLIWGLRFLANASPRRWWTNTRSILDLAAVSREELATLLRETGIAFDYRLAGKLHLYGDAASFQAARRAVDRKNGLGIEQRMLNREGAEEIEPALRLYQGEIAGAVYTPGDALGDAAVYCRALTNHLVREYGMTTLLGHRVCGFRTVNQRLRAIRFLDRDDLGVDMAVLAAGPGAPLLSREVPEARAIRPVRGYSLTIPLTAGSPRVSLTDVKRKLAFAAIGDRFRVAGLADITAVGAGFDGERFGALRTAASSVLSEFKAASTDETIWSGERPTTPSSQPIICASRRTRGLYLNIGHGMLGWTLALGSARRVADLIAR
ncbi:FAD-dependent oxidoreductase [Rhizobium sp. SL42]|uniref:FAD-dependent oxidoreductase n=1 Tax=Rhizobium sp. SL42 TaxID=2806346 RepID=UPI001F271939|nr:FAD-dependent oxidoreductase [Rhizobium sp. SL42]UJW77121.1 FAD-dependent oxidoreductase [Rhizobium sp. SL42]